MNITTLLTMIDLASNNQYTLTTEVILYSHKTISHIGASVMEVNYNDSLSMSASNMSFISPVSLR